MPVAFPFSAIVAQDEMKLAILIAATDQSIGGVLVFGDRGTGKSTAIRALAALLPSMRVVENCVYNCDPDAAEAALCESCRDAERPPGKLKVRKGSVPVVDLPLGATEDRVIGALDLESALTRGEKRFEPGLLARAHRGFLYIDEANLLEDHLVDALLDVAASGENVVEREGLSVRHPARFVLVGSGNPEEGELRPQLLDRFGLSVEVTTPQDLKSRMQVVRLRDEFERDPAPSSTSGSARTPRSAARSSTPRRSWRGRGAGRDAPARHGAVHEARHRRPARRADTDPRRPRLRRAGGRRRASATST
jgi:magnesium chelatase subunit I